MVITVLDEPEIPDHAFEAVRAWRPMSSNDMATLVAKARSFALEGKYELS